MNRHVLRRAAAQWIFAADMANRHDQAHLVAHHMQMPLPCLAAVLFKVRQGKKVKNSEILRGVVCTSLAA